MSNPIVRLGTRGSQLALCQSRMIERALQHAGVRVELIVIKTTGDVTAGPLAEMGGEGVFTKRLQNALLQNEIDLAVHSLKDLPTDPVPGLKIGAVPEREDPRDALVLPKDGTSDQRRLQDLPPGARVGTGSLRRRAQVLRLRPDLLVEDIRGNVDSRLARVDAGDYAAIVLACAGLRRLQLQDRITYAFPESECAPAVGQGALGLEIRDSDRELEQTLDVLNDRESQARALAERSMLRQLQAGCVAPIGACSEVKSGVLKLTGLVLDPDGRERIEATDSGPVANPEELGIRVAASLVDGGCQKWLKS